MRAPVVVASDVFAGEDEADRTFQPRGAGLHECDGDRCSTARRQTPRLEQVASPADVVFRDGEIATPPAIACFTAGWGRLQLQPVGDRVGPGVVEPRTSGSCTARSPGAAPGPGVPAGARATHQQPAAPDREDEPSGSRAGRAVSRPRSTGSRRSIGVEVRVDEIPAALGGQCRRWRISSLPPPAIFTSSTPSRPQLFVLAREIACGTTPVMAKPNARASGRRAESGVAH